MRCLLADQRERGGETLPSVCDCARSPLTQQLIRTSLMDQQAKRGNPEKKIKTTFVMFY